MLVLAVGACTDGTGPVLDLALSETAVGRGHSCGIDTSGGLYCWGRGYDGQLGIGPASTTSRPFPADLDRSFASVTAGYDHTCGLIADGRAFCWGWNPWGQLGLGVGGTGVNRPNPVAGDHRFTVLAAGWYHTCGITVAGELLCWGYNGDGQLGTGDLQLREVPVPVASTASFTAVAAGGAHTCATATSGDTFCWGRNSEGQLGDGTTDRRATPTRVSGGVRYRALTAGRGHTCGLTTDRAIYCWGGNGNGQLGVNSVSRPGVPGTTVAALVARNQAYVQVSAGNDYTCAVDADGTGYCWGRAEYGQLGVATVEDQAQPRLIPAPRFRSITTGPGTHTCGIDNAGRPFCWGNADHGGLGASATTYSPVPIRVDAT